ncbi:response regulator transcription factor [Brevibacillus brevis]|uniref:response regulator transcription factor n=1 Tax=Brevibacillus brevis TaxID=1393 RepID=UPI000D0F0144|nr:response regulator transcription factor [Brevibacillus brevis]PSJ68589.1 DNA-binding response regulator [Brevibacillus brevis]RED34111.1 DNA-binding response OmpR family regulator [Brevibacillus brevis]GEC92102.1 DNA-binding response regulator [Brevibacillus brevis]VEF92319.1 Staphylococcal respiratory response protein A [Brevibacillus brevis]
MKRILLIEDEMPIARLVQVYLERAGYEVQWNEGDHEAITTFLSWKPELVLLDLMLPDHDGLDILNQIRQYGSCPVIIITARGTVPDKLQGLAQGADDYIAKPFDPEEVLARVQAVLRRSSYLTEADTIRLGTLSIDVTAQNALIGKTPLSLMPRDWQLLVFLARHPNQRFSRDQLLDQVWGMDFEGGDRSVDTAVKRLRKSLRPWPTSEGEISTIRGLGYSLRVY